MPIPSFRRLGASVLTLALGLLLVGPDPALAGPKPAKSVAAMKAGAASRPLKPRGGPAATGPAATGSVATGSVAKEASAPEAAAMEAPGVTWTSAEPDELRCGRSRRKLWQPGEGWMVKTVTVCR